MSTKSEPNRTRDIFLLFGLTKESKLCSNADEKIYFFLLAVEVRRRGDWTDNIM